MRGMIKWKPFNTLLNNRDINEIIMIRNKVEKPIIMEDRITEIDNLLKDEKLALNEIDYFGAITGPGSFTGIRIGLTIAKTMAYSLDISIKSISSLTAYLVSNDSNSDKMCLIEDNKGYYVSVFDKDKNSIIPECYSEEVNYNYPAIENKLDIEKILNYVSKLPKDDYYHIKANYVKKIEVEK